MRIRMKTTACGPHGNYYAGMEYDVSKELGEVFTAGASPAAIEVWDPTPAKRKVETAQAAGGGENASLDHEKKAGKKKPDA